MNDKNASLETNSVFIGLKTTIFLQEFGFLKNARSCARFLENTSWAKMVHTVLSQLKQNQKKTSETTIFLQDSGFCCKVTNQFLLLGGENKKLFGHTVLVQKWFCLKSKLVMFEKDLLTLSLFSWLLVFDVLFWFLICFLLLFHNSSFYVLVVVSCCCFGFLDLFCLFCFFCILLLFWRVR